VLGPQSGQNKKDKVSSQSILNNVHSLYGDAGEAPSCDEPGGTVPAIDSHVFQRC